MTSAQFSLWTEDWISVRYLDGRIERVGFARALKDAHLIRSLECETPPLEAVTFRVLLAFALRCASAPLSSASTAVWSMWSNVVLHDGALSEAAVDDYGARHADRFFLFDERYPFLQDPAIRVECPKSSTVNKLLVEAQSGNNPLFWTKDFDATERKISAVDAANALLFQWGDGAGGRCASRSGVADSKASPLRACSVYMLQGRTLLESFTLNALPTPGDDSWVGKDCCAWEAEPGAVLVPGVLGRLTGSTRGLLLVGDASGVSDAYVTWGAVLAEGFLQGDPMVAVRYSDLGKKTERSSLYRLAPADVAWGDAPALISAAASERAKSPVPTRRGRFWVAPPRLLNVDARHADDLLAAALNVADVVCLTHFSDKSKDLAWSRASLGPVAALSSTSGTARLHRARIRRFCRNVVLIANALRDALRIGLAEPQRSDHPLRAPLASGDEWVAQLWDAATHRYLSMVEVCPTDSGLADHSKAVASMALDLYRTATGRRTNGDARLIRQANIGERQLCHALFKFRP